MKGHFRKKAAALALSAVLVTGGVPVQPIADMIGELTLTASADETESVSYIDKDGNTQTVNAVQLTEHTDTSQVAYWYYVTGSVGRQTISLLDNNINVILCDDAVLNINQIQPRYYETTPRLTVWGQAEGTGKLVVNAITNPGSCPIDSTSLTVNGGEAVVYTGATAAIDNDLAFGGGKLTIEKYSAPGGGYSGGGNTGVLGDTTLDYRSMSDRVKVSTYEGSVTIAEGKYFKDNSGNCYSGTLTDEQKSAVAGAELTPVAADDVFTVTFNYNNGSEPETVSVANGTDLSDRPEPVCKNYVFDGWYKDAAFSTACTSVTESGTLYAKWTADPDHFCLEEDTGRYQIKDAAGWDIFCDCIEDPAYNGFSGKEIHLTDDIGTTEEPITRMAGTAEHPFEGQFYGNCFTMTFACTADSDYTAPFRYVETSDSESTPAAIDSLYVYSTIVSEDHKYAAGLVASAKGHVYITNCDVTADISSTATGDDKNLYCGGLVGRSDVDDNCDLTIIRCSVNGELKTNGRYAGGFVGCVKAGAVLVNDCLSSVTINSSTVGEGAHGGFAAVVEEDSYIKFDGCAFNGEFIGTSTKGCGGFIGWLDGTKGIYNSVFDPKTIDLADDSSDSYPSCTFCRNGNVDERCYYTNELGTKQGKKAYTVTVYDNNCFFDFTINDYYRYNGVSGITYYSDNGILKYDGNYISGKDDEVTFRVEPYENHILSKVTLNAQPLAQTETENEFTFTMPGENVALAAETERIIVNVNYVDAKGNEHSAAAFPLIGSDEELSEDWYVVNKDLTLSEGLVLKNNVNLILADNCTLTINDNNILSDKNSNDQYGITVYAQSLDERTAGNLVIDIGENYILTAIDLSGDYVQNGGNVRISSYNSLICRDFTVNAGTVDIINNNPEASGISSFGKCTFAGGTVKITIDNDQDAVIYAINGVLLSGAELSFGKGQLGSEEEYGFPETSVSIAEGLYYKDGKSVYDSSTASSVLRTLKNSTLVTAHVVNIAEFGSKATIKANRSVVADKDTNRTVILSVESDFGVKPKSISVNGEQIQPADGVYSFEMPYENVTVTAEFYHFTGCDLLLDGNTDVNFYFDLTSVQAQNTKIVFAYADKEPFEAEITYDTAKQLYKAVCAIPAAYMAAGITAKVYIGGELAEEHVYSVKQYGEYILNNQSIYPAEAFLVKAMLNYGAYAQDYFGVDTSDVPNAALSAEEKALGDVSIDKFYTSDLPEGITFSGATLTLNSDTTLSLFFESTDQLTFTCEGRTVETKRYDDYQVARIRNISAEEIRNDFTLYVQSGGSTYSVTYSPLNYIMNAVNSSDKKLSDTAKALYFYSMEAVEYLTHYTVTYDLNGADETLAYTTVKCGDSFTLPTPQGDASRSFSGWHTSPAGGTKVGDQGDSYTPSANTRLYAHWKYKVTISNTNSTTAVTAGDDTIVSGSFLEPGTVVKVVISYIDLAQSKEFAITSNEIKVDYYSDSDCLNKTDSVDANTYYFRMPDGEAKIYSSCSTCVIKGTMITLADGTKKPVEQIEPGEELLVWDLETGRYSSSPVAMNHFVKESEYKIIHACFSDGTDIGIAYEHGFFDVTLGKYVYINENTLEDYIGHTFMKQGDTDNNTWDTAALTDVWTDTVTTEVYSPVTARYLCLYTNGILSVTADSDGFVNMFDVDTESMTYDKDKMQADLETYGRFTYDDFKDIVPENIYNSFNAEWLKVAFGKGMLTMDDIKALVEEYGYLF